MAATTIEKIDEKGFPREVKRVLNLVITKSNRKWEFRFATDSKNTEVKIDETDEKVVVTLPRSGFGAPVQFVTVEDGVRYYRDFAAGERTEVFP